MTASTAIGRTNIAFTCTFAMLKFLLMDEVWFLAIRSKWINFQLNFTYIFQLIHLNFNLSMFFNLLVIWMHSFDYIECDSMALYRMNQSWERNGKDESFRIFKHFEEPMNSRTFLCYVVPMCIIAAYVADVYNLIAVDEVALTKTVQNLAVACTVLRPPGVRSSLVSPGTVAVPPGHTVVLNQIAVDPGDIAMKTTGNVIEMEHRKTAHLVTYLLMWLTRRRCCRRRCCS